MNQTQALAKLRKIIGPKLGYRISKDALCKEEREIVRAELLEVSGRVSETKAAMQARREWLLNNDPEYVRLSEQYGAAKKEHDSLAGKAYHCRITVGESNGMFFSVRAEGDNWAEVIAKATQP